MNSAHGAALSAFIEGAPPGELAEVISDIKTLTGENNSLFESAKPALQKYNEEQLAVVKLPGSGKAVLVSSYNSLGNGRYYDLESKSSFAFDHNNQKASAVQSYSIETQRADLITALQTSISKHTREHYPSSTLAFFPSDADSALTILLVANKYSPSNFWNGRFRTTYHYNPSSASLHGTLKCDVHYYEDGNVRLTTAKSLSPTSIPPSSSSSASASMTAAAITKTIATTEKAYQEELNRGFLKLSEGEFKALRRQLPVTRQKVEWEKIGGYRLGQDIGGGRSR